MEMNVKSFEPMARQALNTPVIIYGMGYVGGRIAKSCDQKKIPYIFCDQKADQNSGGTVISPERLIEYPDADIVVASINYYDEIRLRLEQLGIDNSRIRSYLDFWPEQVDWQELEDAADWENVRRRAEIFASWVDSSARSVADYSYERNFLRDFLPESVRYESPDYIRFQNNVPYGDFSGTDPSFCADVSSCLAMLMSFSNPEAVVDHICACTEKAVIASYVTLEELPDIPRRRSINYNNDYTRRQFLDLFARRGFQPVKAMKDPFDSVHTVYLFQREKMEGGASLGNQSG